MTDREVFEEFQAQSAEMAEAVEQDEAEHEYELEVIEPSRPARVSDMNASLFKTIASLALCGWWSASQVTRVFLPGTVFKTGQRAGETRPDKEMTNVFIHAAHPDRRTLTIWYIDGKLESAVINQTRVVRKVSDLADFIEGSDT